MTEEIGGLLTLDEFERLPEEGESNAMTGILRKVLDYLAAGCGLVWVVDFQSRAVTAYRSHDDVRMLTGEDVLEGADVLSGLRIPLTELFGELEGTT